MTTATIGDSGIILGGGPDSFGVEWGWDPGSDPWQPGPAPREESGELAFAHGTWNATEFYGPRSQEFAVTVKAPSHAALHRAHDRWRAAVGLRPFPVTIAEPHVTRWAMLRRRGDLPWTEVAPGEENGGAIAKTSVALHGDDPRIFGSDLRTTSTGYPSTVGGLSWPTQWPATWDATVESGLLLLDNAGSESADVLWRIDGPVSWPRVIDTVTGAWFRLAVDLAAGEWITVDTATGAVLQSGQAGANRRTLWAGSWLYAPPGATSFAFAGADGSAPASVSATWRDTYI